MNKTTYKLKEVVNDQHRKHSCMWTTRYLWWVVPWVRQVFKVFVA